MLYRFTATKSQAARAAAAALMDDDVERVWEIILNAMEQGISISSEEIEAQVERLSEGQTEAFFDRLPEMMQRNR